MPLIFFHFFCQRFSKKEVRGTQLFVEYSSSVRRPRTTSPPLRITLLLPKFPVLHQLLQCPLRHIQLLLQSRDYLPFPIYHTIPSIPNFHTLYCRLSHYIRPSKTWDFLFFNIEWTPAYGTLCMGFPLFHVRHFWMNLHTDLRVQQAVLYCYRW